METLNFDVMVGDWIDVRSHAAPDRSHYEKITPAHMLRDEIWYGIPIKRIHLTKNGFKAREYTDDTEFYYYDCYEINVSFDEGLPEDDIPPVIFLTIEFAEKSLCMPIEYVHELQQAMRLMGCDKKIEL